MAGIVSAEIVIGSVDTILKLDLMAAQAGFPCSLNGMCRRLRRISPAFEPEGSLEGADWGLEECRRRRF